MHGDLSPFFLDYSRSATDEDEHFQPLETLGDMKITDVLGDPVKLDEGHPLVFCFNVNGNHWNLVRVVTEPTAELHIFEPMGRPSSRSGGRSRDSAGGGGGGKPRRGISARNLPERTLEWLEKTWPTEFDKGEQPWASLAFNAITLAAMTSLIAALHASYMLKVRRLYGLS